MVIRPRRKQIYCHSYNIINILCGSDFTSDLPIIQTFPDSKKRIWWRILKRTQSDQVAPFNICCNFYLKSNCSLDRLVKNVACLSKGLLLRLDERGELNRLCDTVHPMEPYTDRLSISNPLLQLQRR